MKKQKEINQELGFTLIEVMAALAIVAFGITAAVSIVSNIGINTSRLEEKVQAQWIASNVAVEIQLRQIETVQSEPYPSTATITMGGRDWYLFTQNTKGNSQNSTISMVDICLNQQKTNCVLSQEIFSLHRSFNAAQR